MSIGVLSILLFSDKEFILGYSSEKHLRCNQNEMKAPVEKNINQTFVIFSVSLLDVENPYNFYIQFKCCVLVAFISTFLDKC